MTIMKKLKKYIQNNLIAVDQLANAILGGDPDETISSRIGKRIRGNQATWPERILAAGLDKLDPNHCINEIEEDEGNDAGVLSSKTYSQGS